MTLLPPLIGVVHRSCRRRGAVIRYGDEGRLRTAGSKSLYFRGCQASDGGSLESGAVA